MTRLLDTLAAAVRRAPALLIVCVVVLTAVFGAVTAGYSVQDQGFENFAPENEVTAALETIAEEFGSAFDPIQLVVESDDGPVLSAEGIEAVGTLRERLLGDPTVSEALAPIPDGAVVSFADLVLGAAAAQQLDPATLEHEALAGLHEGAASQLSAQQAEQVTRLLAGGSTDAEVGAVVVLLDGELDMAERSQAVTALAEATRELPGVQVSTLDSQLLGDDIGAEIQADLSRLLALAFGLIVVILIAIYRRPMDVIASLLGLVFTIVWMQGISTVLGPELLGWTGGMNEMTTAIPILLVGLGVDYGIHLTMRYREERSVGADPSTAATGAIGAVGAALALATITTVVGFMTNVTNPLPPLRDFGVFAAVGVASAFLIMVTFVPAVRLLTDRWRVRRGRDHQVVHAHGEQPPSLLGRISAALAPTATHRPGIVLTAAAVLTVIGGVGATGLSTEFSQTEFFPEDSEALALLDLVDEAFGGDLTETTRILVQGDIDQPGVLAAIHEVEEAAGGVVGVRATDGRASADSVLRRSELVLERIQSTPTPDEAAAAPDEQAAEEAVPTDGGAGAMPPPDPAAVEAFLAAARDAGVGTPEGPAAEVTLRPLVDALTGLDPSAANLVSDDALLIELSSAAGNRVDEMRRQLDESVVPLRDLGLDAVAASDPILIDIVMDELRASQVTGLVLTLLASAVILSIAFWFRSREPVLGVLAIASVGVVVAWVFGLMAAFGIPFNVMTAMVSALAIGIGVPFGIHVVNRFLEDRDRYDNLADAMRSTLQHTGGALVGSALTTIAGFGSLVLSDIRPFRQFGAVLAMTIGLALVASVVVLPAMLSVYTKVRERRRTEPAAEAPRQAAGIP
ncbi:RND family transporter [Egicoccus sp. AB-alg6-2]|uniref:efflux RND transporter permease subunit n=1 Tax=Egicoccus sp. AB-alg6-2 TaxID=3242692 RepID=UPI00359DCE05